MKRKILNTVLVLTLLSLLSVPGIAIEYGVELNPEEKAYEQSFSDVPIEHWAFQYIEELVDRGAINGYPDGKFYPNKTVTREEFAKIMVVAAGLQATPAVASSYADVPLTHWASPFIETAKPYMTAYQSGGQAYFKPTDGALREDMAVAVVMLKGYDTRLADLSIIRTMFSDIDAISTGAQPYVALAVENGIISGYNDGTFRGQATITRCEAAAILWRAFQYGGDNKLMPGEVPTPVVTPAPTVPPEPTVSEVPGGDPTQEEESSYTMDTVAAIRYDLCSMVLTDDGIVYYIDGDTLYASGGSESVNLRNGLSYPLKREDKNRTFALEDAALAYDSKQGTVYLLGNEQRRMVIYDVTDLSAPTCVLAADLKDTNYDGAAILYKDTNAKIAMDIEVLSNGALLVPIQEDRANGVIAPCICMVSPARGTTTLWGAIDNTVVVEDKVAYLNGGTTMEVAKVTAPTNTTMVSVEGDLPMAIYACSGPDGIYFWDNNEGLVSLDLDGWRHVNIPMEQVECIDLMPMLWQAEDICVNKDGTCAIYDKANKLIRMISERAIDA